jgi:hypothetical protein
MFTSFGYFNNDVENSKFIKYASDHISKAGYFVFDYLNPTYVVNNLIKSSEKSIDDYNIVEHRSIENNRVQKEIVISNSDNLHRFYESVRLYSYQEIVTMFKKYGFQIIKEFGDYKGSIYDEKTSERMILFFTKK